MLVGGHVHGGHEHLIHALQDAHHDLTHMPDDFCPTKDLFDAFTFVHGEGVPHET